MTAVILLTLYAVEMVTYYYAHSLFYGKILRRYYIPFLTGIGYAVFLLIWGQKDLYFAQMVAHLLPLFVTFLLQNVNMRVRITNTITVFFIITCVSELLLMLADGVMYFTAINIALDVKQLLVYSIQLLIFLLLVSVKNRLDRNSQKRIKFLTHKNIIFAVIFMSISMLFATSGLNWARKRIDNPEFQSLSLVICVLANMGVCLLGLFSIYVDKTNKKIQELADNEKRIMDMQVRYYDTLLEREEDTRKYRHDMSNHLICLEQLVKQQDMPAVENYLSRMQQKMEEIKKRCFSTGNDILDILTNHYVSILNYDTEVRVSGRIHTTMDQMQLCTIYANLLQNAVEELKRCEGATLLEVVFTQGKEYFQIAIRNTLSEVGKRRQKAKVYITAKADKRNHGFGLSNVKKTVEEIGGILEINEEAEYFNVLVSMKVN